MARDHQLTRLAAALLLALAVLAGPMSAAADDTGLIVSAAAEKKLSKKASAEVEAEFRSRNDFRTADRLALSLSGEYKLCSWLKASLGYQLLIDNNAENISYNYNADGTVLGFNNWRPSYWGTRHRATVSLTASYKWRRVGLSLRESYRYTYRPLATTNRYDFDNGWWEDTDVRSKHQHMLRSRVKAQWDIPKSKFTPWASAELFTDTSFDKLRLQAGVDYAIQKKHVFGISYRYQYVRSGEDDNEPNAHYLGLSYKFKF